MASSVLVGLKAIFDDKGIRDAEKQFAAMGRSLKSTLGAIGIGVGLGAITNGLKEATKAAVEDQKSQALLATQLRNTIGASDDQIASVEKSIRTMQLQASVADDVIRPAFAALVRSTGDVEKATALTSLALDVAAGTGKDLGAVSLALGKAVNGSTTSLLKLVPSIKGASDPMGTLAEQFKGAAEAAANNDPFQRLSITLGELQETLGAVFIPMVNDFAKMLSSADFAISFNNLVIAIKNSGIALDNLFKQVSGKGALNTIVDLAAAAAVGVGQIAFWLGDVATTIGYIIDNKWDKAGNQMATYFDRYNKFVNNIYAEQDKAAADAKNNKTTPFLDALLPGGGTGGAGSPVTKKVKTLFDTILEENRKQMARIRLANKGVTGGLAEAIIGSGADWYKTYQQILNSTGPALEKLKKSWSTTAAGIAEASAIAQEAAEQAAKAAEELKAANEALLADLNDQLASAQARLDELTSTLTPAAKTVIEVYNDAKQAYDSLVESSANFAKTIPDLVNGIKTMTKLAEPIGQFESQVVASFGNVESSLKNALDSKLITDASYRDLSAWAKREMALMQDIARQRDALAQKISLAEAVYNDSKNAIMAYGNINGLIKTTTQTITQSQTQIVNGITTTLQKSVEQISKTNIVDEYKNILTKTKAFAAQLNQLKKMGLNKDLFKQIVDAGVEAGGATAAGIIEGGQDSVTELNSIFAELNTVGDAVAETTTVVMFNNGVDVMGGFINGMKAQAEALAATAATLATTFADAFGTALKSALEIAIDDAKKALAAAIAGINAEIAAAKAELLRIQGEITKITAPVVAVPIPVVPVPQDNFDDTVLVGRGAGALGFKGGTSTVDGKATINLTVNAGLGTNGAQLGGQIVELIKKYEKSSGAVFA